MNLDELYPPPNLNFIGGGMFKETGGQFLGYFIQQGGLKPHERVLDVGCGIGRMAIPLTQFLDKSGSYEGFDIVPLGIEWCRAKITPQYPNFRFQLADVYNKVYYPHGRQNAADYVFPYESESFDFVFLASVFTHLLPGDFDNYLYEIARVLRVGGRLFCTFLLLNSESNSLLAQKKGLFSFSHRFGVYRVEVLEAPEQAIAYDESYVLRAFARRGLNVRTPIVYGSWCGRTAPPDADQDMFLAEKTRGLPRAASLAHSSLRYFRTLASHRARALRRKALARIDPSAAAKAIIKGYLTVSPDELKVLRLLVDQGSASGEQLRGMLYGPPHDAASQKLLEGLVVRGLIYLDGHTKNYLPAEGSTWVSSS